jgi:glutathionylspermidine synthase
MKRLTGTRRPNWQHEVEKIGFTYHTIDNEVYWDESGWYEFTLTEIERIETATSLLHAMCLETIECVLEDDRLDEFDIPPQYHAWIRESWDRDDPTLYGRFDLAWDGTGDPKLLEYNADTPTSLFEAAVVQWDWLQAVHPQCDQFNSLHEELIAAWRYMRKNGWEEVAFAASAGHEEDMGNVTYLRDTAHQAGIRTEYLNISDIGLDSAKCQFVDASNRSIDRIFKLYPWEWMLSEEYGRSLLVVPTHWIEPPWKMILSNKALLVLLWELFPNHKYLLEASWSPLAGDCIEKPIVSREGSNIRLLRSGRVAVETDGPYGDADKIYQTYHPLFSSRFGNAVLGSWIIGDRACGLGIREDINLITHNTSRFVPHLIRD